MANSPKKAQKALQNEILKNTPKILQVKRVIEAKAVCTVPKLNIRQLPDLNAPIVGHLFKGSIVDVFNDLGDWVQIIINGQHKGFVMKQYVEILRYEKIGEVNVNTLNVRLRPYFDAPILGHLKKGEVVKIITEYSDWVKINYNQKEAFVAKQYLDISDIPLKSQGELSQIYYHQREDIQKVPLEPTNKLSNTSDFNANLVIKTWNNYGNLLKKISNELAIDINTVISVLCVESAGEGFSNGRMIIRFENHIFDLYYGKKNPENFEKFFKYDKAQRRGGHYFRDDENKEWEVCHTGQDMEWKVFEFAKKLDETAALYSISMGAPQIMGFNYAALGFKSVQEMFEKFSKDIRYQICSLFDFCKAKPDRVKYLQLKDFYNFAAEYNGLANPSEYEYRLKKFYEIARELTSKLA